MLHKSGGIYLVPLFIFRVGNFVHKIEVGIYIGIICCAVLVGDLKGTYCFETLEIILLHILP